MTTKERSAVWRTFIFSVIFRYEIPLLPIDTAFLFSGKSTIEIPGPKTLLFYQRYRKQNWRISKALHILPAFNAEEQKLIARLQQLPEVQQRCKEIKNLQPEIYERPAPTTVKAPPGAVPRFHCYCIAFVEKDSYGLNDFIFLIQPFSDQIWHLDESGRVLS